MNNTICRDFLKSISLQVIDDRIAAMNYARQVIEIIIPRKLRYFDFDSVLGTVYLLANIHYITNFIAERIIQIRSLV